MPRKPKFRPRITRVKLNPEQAVLSCGCYLGWRLQAKEFTTDQTHDADNHGAFCAGSKPGRCNFTHSSGARWGVREDTASS